MLANHLHHQRPLLMNRVEQIQYLLVVRIRSNVQIAILRLVQLYNPAFHCAAFLNDLQSLSLVNVLPETHIAT